MDIKYSRRDGDRTDITSEQVDAVAQAVREGNPHIHGDVELIRPAPHGTIIIKWDREKTAGSFYSGFTEPLLEAGFVVSAFSPSATLDKLWVTAIEAETEEVERTVTETVTTLSMQRD